MRILFGVLSICLFLAGTSFLQAQEISPRVLFENSKDGYRLFRIPALITTNSGRIIAFAEGRKNIRDHGNIDLVIKTSDDNGQTWSALKVIWNEGRNTCGNPAPVVDSKSGDVLVMATLNNDKVFVLRSKDEGQSWEAPKEITPSIKPSDWQWYASGPGHAIQVQNGAEAGRIIIPCNHTLSGQDRHISHVIYSDDGGFNWQIGGIVPMVQTDECTVAELSDGRLLLNMRTNDRTKPYRKVAYSADAGKSWSVPVYDTALTDPVCEGALLRYAFEPNVLLFSNPHHPSKRQNLSISVSTDDGKTWPEVIPIYPGKSAYSDMTVLPNGNVLCIFEKGKFWPYGGIFMEVIPKGKIIR